ncbi:MAG: DMT family transporter [Bacteroidales bacterium]|nr:DMT family transporter [Bacteroidales bacterium]
MLYLISAIIISSGILVLFKFFKKIGIDNMQAITINYLIGVIFGFLVYPNEFSVRSIIEAPWLPYAIISGVLFIITFLLFAYSSQKAGVAITAVSSKMSVIIPVCLGVILLDDSMGILKITGIIAALFAFYFTLKKGKKLKVSSAYFYLPFFLFLGNGTIDSILKYTEHHFVKDDTLLFLSTIFFISLMIGIIISTIKFFKNKQKLKLKNVIGGSILGLMNFSTTYFLIMAMGVFQSSVLFPINNVGIVALSALAGLIIFKEKLSLINWIGILFSIFAILLISFSM